MDNVDIEKKKNEIEGHQKWAKRLLIVGTIAMIAAPLIFTQFKVISFMGTGQIGDTIGGITNPIVALRVYHIENIAKTSHFNKFF